MCYSQFHLQAASGHIVGRHVLGIIHNRNVEELSQPGDFHINFLVS